MGDLPKCKEIRIKDYDYSSPGAYFITICTHNRRCLLSHIVGRGLAPAPVFYGSANNADVRCKAVPAGEGRAPQRSVAGGRGCTGIG